MPRPVGNPRWGFDQILDKTYICTELNQSFQITNDDRVHARTDSLKEYTQNTPSILIPCPCGQYDVLFYPGMAGQHIPAKDRAHAQREDISSSPARIDLQSLKPKPKRIAVAQGDYKDQNDSLWNEVKSILSSLHIRVEIDFLKNIPGQPFMREVEKSLAIETEFILLYPSLFTSNDLWIMMMRGIRIIPICFHQDDSKKMPSLLQGVTPINLYEFKADQIASYLAESIIIALRNQ
jgi:hypothetical protein